MSQTEGEREVSPGIGDRGAGGDGPVSEVRLLLRWVVIDQGLPLEMKVPNAETRAAMEESRALLAARRARMASAEALENGGHQ